MDSSWNRHASVQLEPLSQFLIHRPIMVFQAHDVDAHGLTPGCQTLRLRLTLSQIRVTPLDRMILLMPVVRSDIQERNDCRSAPSVCGWFYKQSESANKA